MSYLAADEIEKYCGLISGVTTEHVAAASVLIDAFKGCSFEPVRRTEKIELRGNFRGELHGRLRHYPCAEILGVTAKTEGCFGERKVVYDPACLEFDYDESAYFRFCLPSQQLMFCRPPRRIEVTYTSGYKEIPELVKRACGMLACNIKQMGGLMKWTSRDDYDVKVTLSNEGIMTQEIKGILRGVTVA